MRGFFVTTELVRGLADAPAVLDSVGTEAYDGPEMHLENDRGTGQSTVPSPPTPTSALRALCIARHCILSEHIARYFAEMGIVTTNAVGLETAGVGNADWAPDVVICDYDVLASIPLEQWEHDKLLSRTPVVAVSLTRHAEELQLLDVNGIAGFLYLPTLDRSAALRILYAAAARPRYVLPPLGAPARPVEHS